MYMFVWQHRYYESWSCCGDTDFMSKECAREKKAFENEKMDEQLAVKYGDKKKRARPKGAPSEYVERLVNLNKARPKSARDPS